MAKVLGFIVGVCAGAILAPIVVETWVYLDASNFGTTAPPKDYDQFVLIGALVIYSPPAAAIGGLLGFLAGWRIDRRRSGRKAPGETGTS
jgi:hypothetical protein